MDVKLSTDISLYLLVPSGQCIYSHHLGQQPSIDEQLIGGLIMAQKVFLDELSNHEESISLLNIEANKRTHIRSYINDDLTGVLFFRDEVGFSSGVYNQLDTLLKDLVLRFNNYYRDDLEEFINKGSNNFPDIKAFVDNEIVLMKTEMQITYLQFIITEIISRTGDDVMDSLNKIQQAYKILAEYTNKKIINYELINGCYALIKAVNEGIIKKLQESITYRDIIKEVNNNKQMNSIWELFKVPIIKI